MEIEKKYDKTSQGSGSEINASNPIPVPISQKMNSTDSREQTKIPKKMENLSSGAPEARSGDHPDTEILRVNYTSSTATNDAEPAQRRKKINWKKFTLVALMTILPLILLSGAAYGFETYQRNFQTKPLESVLPADVDVIIKLNSNPESEQFQLLEKNLEKFPGYDLLKKKVDSTGAGKSISQLIQDKLRESNLDFETDIKPLLADNIYFLLPDVRPLGQDILDQVTFLTEESRKSFAFNKQIPNREPENQDPEHILGDMNVRLKSDESTNQDKMDFLTASQIKDLKEARKVLAKMEKNDRYQATSHKFEGFTYLEISQKQPANVDGQQSKKGIGSLFKTEKTFHALIGGNWIMSSSEEMIKRIIEKQVSQQLVDKYFFRKKSEVASLADDNDFHNVLNNLAQNSPGENLALAYYKLNLKEVMRKNCLGKDYCPEGWSDYIRFPENIISGFSLKMESSGISIRQTTNQNAFGNIENKPLDKGLVQKMPQKVDNRYADIYVEQENLKDYYYNFKKNILTEKGLQEMNSTISGLNSETGIDIERDFIDQINGDLCFAIYTGPDTFPEGVLVTEVKNKEVVADTMRRIVEKTKQVYTEASGFSNDYSETCKNPDQNSANLCKYSKDEEAKRKKIADTNLTESEVSGGKIYSFAVPDSNFSFNYGFSGNTFVLGSHYAATANIIQELSENKENKIVGNKFYSQITQKLGPEGYTKTFINSEGLMNIVDYIVRDFSKNSPYMGTIEENPETEDYLFAFGSIIRTSKLIGSAKAYKDGMYRTSHAIYFQELPQIEKDRAEAILNRMENSLTSAEGKAKIASFRSTAVSINPAAMSCADESRLNTANPGSAASICQDPKIDSSAYPVLSKGICDGDTYSVTVKDETPADGMYNYAVSCPIDGKTTSVICTENGCTP